MKNALTLLTAWEQTVRRDPRALAVRELESGKQCTRAELEQRAEAWAVEHRDNLAGETAVFAMTNGVAWLTTFLGLLKVDAVIVALDPGEPLAAQRSVAKAIGASRLWTGEGWEQMDAPKRRRNDGGRLVKLTSGSTGKPQALRFTDAQMLADGRQICATMEISADDVNFALIPFGHSYGLGNLVVPLLLQGTAVTVGSLPMPHVVAGEIERSQATVFPAVPAVLRGLSEADVAAEKLKRLRTIISAGAPLAPEVAQQFLQKFGRRIHSFYGSSETGGISYDRTGEATLRGSVGTALSGVRVEVGAGGKLQVTSAAVVTLGRRVRGVAEEGMHEPADFAAIDARGEITLLGRAGRQVKIAGRRVNLEEVERTIRAIAGVREVWVGAKSEPSEMLLAAVAGEVTTEQLRISLREKLPTWKIPRRWCVLPELPRTARGKVDTQALKTRLSGPRAL